MSLCIRYYAIIVSTEAILSDLVVLFFSIFPTCACVSFQLHSVHACAVEKIPPITLKSIRNLSVVSEIDRIPWRKNCDRTVQGRISYFYYVTFPSFLFLYQAVDFKCNPLVRMLSYFVK